MLGLCSKLVRVTLKLGQVVERIGPAKLARINQTHEEVAHMGTVGSLIEQGVLAVEDGLLDSALVMPSWLPSFSRKRQPVRAPASGKRLWSILAGSL